MPSDKNHIQTSLRKKINWLIQLKSQTNLGTGILKDIRKQVSSLTSLSFTVVFLLKHTYFMDWLPVAIDMHLTNLETPEEKGCLFLNTCSESQKLNLINLACFTYSALSQSL